jgi:hypothetical protein
MKCSVKSFISGGIVINVVRNQVDLLKIQLRWVFTFITNGFQPKEMGLVVYFPSIKLYDGNVIPAHKLD